MHRYEPTATIFLFISAMMLGSSLGLNILQFLICHGYL